MAGMMQGLDVMAYHGWGFTPDCWQAWQARFLSLGACQWYSYDRGYGGNASAKTLREPPLPQLLRAESDANSYKVVLTHSYGLHWWASEWQASELPARLDLLVIFGGFQHFHPSEPKAKRRSQRVLHQMLAQFEQDPLTVLRQFYQNCDYPDAILQEGHSANTDTRLPTFDYTRLHSDLQSLDQAQLDLTPFSQIPRILIFQGLQDRIVPVAQAEQLWEQVRFSRGDATRFSGGDAARTVPSETCQYIPLTGGHALPFTHLDACWSRLQPMLSAIRAA